MSDPFIAQITMFGGNFAPRGWAFCDGQLLPIAQNQALFSLIGTIYGGDGRTTFALPDLRSRSPLHEGHGPGLSPRNLGSKGGTETNTLLAANMAAGFPNVQVHNGAADQVSPVGKFLAEPVDGNGNALAGYNNAGGGGNLGGVQTGGGQAVNNMHPYLAINFIIALVGVFPSRS